MRNIYRLTKGSDVIEGTNDFICQKLGIPADMFTSSIHSGEVCGYKIQKVGLDDRTYKKQSEVDDFKRRWEAMQKRFEKIVWEKVE